MVKLVIHCADIHIRNYMRYDEYSEQLSKFIEKCKEISSDLEHDEVRILICGDLIHQKNTISPELFSFTSTFIRSLEEIGKVVVIAGNHDLLINNSSRKDAISSLFETASFDNAFLLDAELGYESGYVVDDNITWALYSIYDDFNRPDIEEARKEHPNNKIIGLYHGMVIGSTLDNGTVLDDGIDRTIFNGCDCVMCGDIHKRQEMKCGNILAVYSGSLIQQNFGETITKHGFSLWNMETMEHKFIDLGSSYGLYKLEINDFDDIDNDKEVLVNF